MARAQYDEVFLAFEERPQIGSIRLNCTLEELHTIRQEVTTAPVEGGANRADHIVRQPAMLQLTGVISDRPDNIVDQEVGVIPAAVASLAPSWNLLNLQGDPGRDSLIGVPQVRLAGLGDLQTLIQNAREREDQGDDTPAVELDAGTVGSLAAGLALAGGTATLRRLINRNRDRRKTRGKYSYRDDFLSAWGRLEALVDSRTPFRIITALKTYQNMIPMEIGTPETDSSDLVFRAVFKEFREVGVRREQYLSDDFADEGAALDVTGNSADIDLSAEVADALGSAQP